MIKHTVMFRFRKDAPEDKKKQLLDEYMQFPRKFPSMRNFAFGENISERDQTYEYAFSVEFETEEALKEYLASDAHEEHVVERFRPIVEQRSIASFKAIPNPVEETQKIDWNTKEWIKVRHGLIRKGFSGEMATIAVHKLEPGHETRPHSHPHEQIAYIVSGQVNFHVGDEVHLLGPEELIVIPPHAVHYAEVVGDESVVNLDVFAPARPEYTS